MGPINVSGAEVARTATGAGVESVRRPLSGASGASVAGTVAASAEGNVSLGSHAGPGPELVVESASDVSPASSSASPLSDPVSDVPDTGVTSSSGLGTSFTAPGAEDDARRVKASATASA